jgi:hypothetical protein
MKRTARNDARGRERVVGVESRDTGSTWERWRGLLQGESSGKRESEGKNQGLLSMSQSMEFRHWRTRSPSAGETVERQQSMRERQRYAFPSISLFFPFSAFSSSFRPPYHPQKRSSLTPYDSSVSRASTGCTESLERLLMRRQRRPQAESKFSRRLRRKFVVSVTSDDAQQTRLVVIERRRCTVRANEGSLLHREDGEKGEMEFRDDFEATLEGRERWT